MLKFVAGGRAARNRQQQGKLIQIRKSHLIFHLKFVLIPV